MCKIETWATYRKSVKEFYTVRDNTKGWIMERLEPTLRKNGFNVSRWNDIQYDKRKPRKILQDDYKELIDKCSHIVYYVDVPTASYAGYNKWLNIFYKLSENDR
jgi:hypothetical protein